MLLSRMRRKEPAGELGKHVCFIRQVPEHVNGKSYEIMRHEAIERWPSAAARDQHQAEQKETS